MAQQHAKSPTGTSSNSVKEYFDWRQGILRLEIGKLEIGNRKGRVSKEERVIKPEAENDYFVFQNLRYRFFVD